VAAIKENPDLFNKGLYGLYLLAASHVLVVLLYVVLKTRTPKKEKNRVECPECQSELEYIKQYKMFYCKECKRYV